MNTKVLQDQTPTTAGICLRQARENMGLSQQAVAEKLCLKVSIVRDIEDDHANLNLASIFLRGYIRSYARLVHISEEELMPIIAKQAPIKASNVTQMQGLSLCKTGKKRDGWLMWFTWFILFVVINLTVAWWWQNHQAQQQYIASMTNQYFSQLSQRDSVTPVLFYDGAGQTGSASPETVTANADSNMLVINFIGDCWLEVFDASGKKLISGIQHSGTMLNLTGQAPYKLKIGAPAAVQVQYQGKSVDLSRFIRSKQVARLTVADQ